MIFQDYYTTPGVRETCHQIKDGSGRIREEALIRAAIHLVKEGKINSADYLIPAPQHTGTAVYTKSLSEKISILTGAKVLDIVKCRPHAPLYDQKKEGLPFSLEAEFYLEKTPPKTGTFLFIDNVIATGETFSRINDLFEGKLKPMPYAVDYTHLTDKKILTLLREEGNRTVTAPKNESCRPDKKQKGHHR